MQIIDVPIKDIAVRARKRFLTDVSDIKRSISEIGLINPITLREDYTLVAGNHRLEACRQLGWDTIPAKIVTVNDLKAELLEIDENLARSDLSVLDRAEHLKRRKEIYLELYPETEKKVGRELALKRIYNTSGARGESPPASKGLNTQLPPVPERPPAPPSFVESASKLAGISTTTVKREVKIATDIDEKAKEIIRGTDLADSKTELLKLSRIKDKNEQKEVAQRVIDGKAKSVHEAVINIRREERHQELGEPGKIEGKYNVILADPPWKYEFAESATRAIDNQYPPMKLEDIKVLDVPSEDVSILFLWATAPKLEEALEVMKAWGFKYRTHGVWYKRKKGMGYWFRVNHELLLIGVKGDFPPPAVENRFDSVFETDRAGHSEKPDIVYQMIEQMFPTGRFLELFARKKYNDKWSVWGNEV